MNAISGCKRKFRVLIKNFSKNKLKLLVFILVPVFYLLYLYGYQSDIWANLFASMVTILIIEKMVLNSEKVQYIPSVEYIKSRAWYICNNVVISMTPPYVENDFEKLESYLEEYLDNLAKIRKETITDIEHILDISTDLISPSLRNQLSNMLELLYDPDWSVTTGPRIWHYTYHWIIPLSSALGLVNTITSYAIKIVQENNLGMIKGYHASENKMDPEPIFEETPNSDRDNAIKNMKDILKRSISIRQAVQKKFDDYYSEK